MDYTKNISGLSFCSSVIYETNKDYTRDYSSAPRPWHNISFMLEGRGTVITADGSIEIKKGDILYIPQGCEYISNWSAEPRCVYHTVHFGLSLSCDPFRDKIVKAQLLPNGDFASLYELARELHRYRNTSGVDSLKFLSAFYNLCAALLPSAVAEDENKPASSIAPAIEYLENNFREPCKVDYLASLCHISESRFFYLFKKSMGCSPISYKNKIAVQKAAQALVLERNAGIERIAFEYGFESPIYFRRIFKRITGKTPSAYRKEEGMI